MTVVVKKIGGSVAVVIPKSLAREMELTEGSQLDVTSDASAIVMRKRNGKRPRRSMKEIVAGISPAAYKRRNREFAADRPVGKEIW